MSPNHYNSFNNYVNKGIFDNQSMGTYLRDISKRAKHLVSPVGPYETEIVYDLNRLNIKDYMGDFIERGIPIGNVLPLDGLLCVEDDVSAVFIENDPEKEKTLRLTSFREVDKHKSISIINNGLLTLISYDGEGNLFKAGEINAGFIEKSSYLSIGNCYIEVAFDDLVKSANTVLEQIALMEIEGMLKGIEKK